MASSNYAPYNYQNYQQSASQQYSGYQTAPAASANIAQNPRPQYQQAPPAAPAQNADYIPSYAGQSYSNQGNTYGAAQEGTWAGNTTYGSNRETTRGAAEVLRNMSNTTYGQSTTTPVARETGFTATNSAAGRYANASPVQQPQVQHAQQTHTAHSYAQGQTQAHAQAQAQAQAHAQAQAQAHAHSQPRPRSVNANHGQQSSSSRGLPSPAVAAGYPSQRAQNVYSQAPQRSASPPQPQYNRNTSTPVNSARTTTNTSTTQYPEYRHRQLPSVIASRNPQSSTAPTSYSYAENQTTPAVAPTSHSYAENQTTAAAAPVAQPSAVAEQYSSATTVDPMAVYNPYSEYERQQEKLRQQKAAEDAIRAEEERKAEERRQEEERKKEEKRRKAEEEGRARQAALPKRSKSQARAPSTAAPESSEEDQEAGGDGSDSLEAEIRKMMAKMRELNSKDPALLARIWEDERRAKGPKSPTTQPKPAPKPAAAQPAPVVQQRKKAAAKQTPNVAGPGRAQQSAASTPVTAQAPVPRAPAPVAAPVRPSGNTIWPPEKKAQLATAATTYLNDQNPSNPTTSDQFLTMLDSNPSYIELCELLEGRSLKLDRAAFAKALLTAVPDVNSASRSQAQARTYPQPVNGTTARVQQAPTAVMLNRGPAAPSPHPQYAPAHSPLDRSSYPPFPGENAASASHSPAPVAQMIPIKPELKPPANKEEAARKRTFNDLIDLTALSEDDVEPALKKQHVGSMYSYNPPGFDEAMDVDEVSTPTSNFPVAATLPSQPLPHLTELHQPPPLPPNDLRTRNLVQQLDKTKALRRNGYNIKTIARDVLLACGRHPEERHLNAHLEVLKANLSPQVTNDVDLSTLRWDLIDPGQPPKGYYRDATQALAEDADDEEDSEDEEARSVARSRAPSQTIGGGAAAQALPPTNPFKAKRGRGRPPRHSYPDQNSYRDQTSPTTPERSSSSAGGATMSAGPRPSAGSVGYSAFRAATEYGPDGKPLPRKKGRPVGWRKALHGSAAAQARPAANGHTGPLSTPNRFVPSQPSSLRNVKSGEEEPITVQSRSPSVINQSPKYQSFKCKWQNCKADLHNLETLRKHVQKVHRKQTLRGTLECLWDDCGKVTTIVDPNNGIRTQRQEPFSYTDEAKWRSHLDMRHFSALSWELGDGPASGLSGKELEHHLPSKASRLLDANDAEEYLSDAQGRRVTPRISADPSRLRGSSTAGGDGTTMVNPSPRGRGRPPKATQEQKARDTQDRLVAQKKRLGGPGMDRGGSTLVNEKRRKGFSDDDQTEEEFVDAEL